MFLICDVDGYFIEEIVEMFGVLILIVKMCLYWVWMVLCEVIGLYFDGGVLL